MNAKLVNTFLDAAVEVLEAEVGGQVKRGAITMEQSKTATDDVNVHLALVGGLEGAVVYSMSEDTALRIVSRMIGQPMDELDDLAQSGIAELGNVITGRAGAMLVPAGCDFRISVPTLIIGKGATLSILDHQRLVVPLLCADGTVEIHLSFREAPRDG